MLLAEGAHPGTVNFDSDRALEKCYRQNEAVAPFEIQQDSLYPTKSSIIDCHSFSDLQERPRLAGESGCNKGLDGSDFGLVNWDWGFAYPDDQKNPRCGENGKPILHVESAKQIAGKERSFNFLDPVRPPSFALVQRQKPLIALTMQKCSHGFFVTSFNLQREPGMAILSCFSPNLQGGFWNLQLR